MEYAVLTVDKDAVSRNLEKMGKSVKYEDFTSSISVLKTDATLLDMKKMVATINKCDAESCTARVYEKDLRNRKNIWSFLNEDKKLNVAVIKDY